MRVFRPLRTRLVPQTRRRIQTGSAERLIIFDKDGTLIDFHSMWGPWVEQQAQQLEKFVKTPITDNYFKLMGYDGDLRRVKSLGALVATPMNLLYPIGIQALKTAGMKQEEAEAAARSVWKAPDPIETCKPITELNTLFDDLRSLGFKIAVFTTDCRGPTRASLKHLGVDFDEEMMGCGDDPTPSKPRPDQILKLCETAGIPPERTVMVGDTPPDMLAGRNAKVHLNIGVLGGASTAEDLSVNADLIVRDISHIPGLWRKINA